LPDPFESHSSKLESPGAQHFTIAPSDTVFLATPTRAIYVNAAGTAVLEDRNGNAISYNLAAGQIVPFRAVRVRATGTTASLIGWI
jgi:hypothetical protein